MVQIVAHHVRTPWWSTAHDSLTIIQPCTRHRQTASPQPIPTIEMIACPVYACLCANVLMLFCVRPFWHVHLCSVPLTAYTSAQALSIMTWTVLFTALPSLLTSIKLNSAFVSCSDNWTFGSEKSNVIIVTQSLHTCEHTCMSFICFYTYIHVYIYIYTCIYIHSQTSKYIDIYIYMYTVYIVSIIWSRAFVCIVLVIQSHDQDTTYCRMTIYKGELLLSV